MAWQHYIKIEEKKGNYYFELWYAGKQAMGYSKPYKTYADCIRGINDFKEYLNNKKPSFENGLITISSNIKPNRLKVYSYKFYDDTNNLLYESRKIEKKINCEKSATSTCNTFVNADIKN